MPRLAWQRRRFGGDRRFIGPGFPDGCCLAVFDRRFGRRLAPQCFQFGDDLRGFRVIAASECLAPLNTTAQ